LIDAGETPRNIKNLLNDAIYKEVMNIDVDSLIWDDNGVPLVDGLGDDYTQDVVEEGSEEILGEQP